MKNNVLVILGMHRSGTSLTANWIHSCGLNIGDRLVGANVGNVLGHFEDQDFHDLHEEIFRSNGIPEGGLKKIEELNITNSSYEKLKSIIQFKNKKYNQWGWKEPRTCLFVDEYEKNIDKPYYLVVYRDADEVVDSLLRRTQKKLKITCYKKGGLYKLNYMFRSKQIFKGLQKNYIDDYFDSWIQCNQNILSLIGQISKERYRVVNYKTLNNDSSLISKWLKETGFQLKEKSFSEVFQDELIKSKIKPYDIDIEKRNEVINIQKKFNNYIRIE